MLNFSLFDSILDPVFIVDAAGLVVYCNDGAATFCSSSTRRLVNKVRLEELIRFDAEGFLPFTDRSPGWAEPTAQLETPLTVLKTGRSGRVQLAVRPFGDNLHWVFILRDVSLEETLATKYRVELARSEAYARNLEGLVAERTSELNSVNLSLNAILNSLGQGFFTFDAKGECGKVFTRACETTLETLPTGRKAWDVLGMKDNSAEFAKWSSALFGEFLPFEEMAPLGPNLFPHSQGKRIALEYYPIRKTGESLDEIVVVATDRSAEFAAQTALEAERQFAEMVVKFTKNKDRFTSFLLSAKTALERLSVLAESEGAPDEAVQRETMRVLHTLEGEAGAFSLREFRQGARTAQQAYGAGPAEYRRALGELKVGFQAFLDLNQDLFKLPRPGASLRTNVALDDLTEFLHQLSASTGSGTLAREFRERFLRVNVGERLEYFDGVIQTVAENLGKRILPLKILGGDVRIFPDPYEDVFAALVHAFRNAVDHGIETPEDREWAGKPVEGKIEAEVLRDGRSFKILVRDDGRGIDVPAVREKLIERYPDREFGNASDAEVLRAVCLPGFTSRTSVGEWSGRGVGLDALAEAVTKLGGTIDISSVLGAGTTVTLDLPSLDQDVTSVRSA